VHQQCALFPLFVLHRKSALNEAVIPSVMTTFAVSVGMLPVAMGSAIGLERLAPLGAVAIGGLMVGTFLTLLFIPIIFILITKDKKEEPAS